MCHDFKYFGLLDEILMKKVKNTCAWNLYRSGSGQMMRVRSDPDPQQLKNSMLRKKGEKIVIC
jgi:hypothetical protein